MQLPLFKHLEFRGRISARSSAVSLSAWATPSEEDVFDHVTDFITADPDLFERLRSTEEVWIKPNVTSGEPPERGRTTQPSVLDGVIRAVCDLRGSRRSVFVADSSVIGTDTNSAARTAGVKRVCDDNNVPFIDLRASAFVEVDVPDAKLFPRLMLNAPFTERRIFKINLGKIKMTYGSAVAFCTKNSKGVLHDEQKLAFHVKGLQPSLCDLAKCLSWDLAVLEGLPMSQLGEPAGNGPLGLCTDPVVLDCFFALVFRIPWETSHHLATLSEAAGVTEAALQSLPGYALFHSLFAPLSYSTSSLSELGGQYSVSIIDRRPCSACLESFAKALRKIALSPGCRDSAFVLGCSPDGILEEQLGSHPTFFVGNCSFLAVAEELRTREFPEALIERWRRSRKVPGCPPTIDCMRKMGTSAGSTSGGQ